MNINNLEKIIEQELEKVESIWKQVGKQFDFFKADGSFSLIEEDVETKIPGFPFLKDGKPKVADFIAFVLDIRNSTNHLTQAISEKTAKASLLKRVLFETTAINTMGSIIIKEYKGGITEFLGDGFLALFKVEEESKPIEVYKVHNAAKKCLTTTSNIVNKVLFQRYMLPPLEIGIGLAYSKAIVTLVGLDKNHPKAIGECVYRASKLSIGANEILIDERLKQLWPKDDNGILNFRPIQLKEHLKFKAYKIGKNN